MKTKTLISQIAALVLIAAFFVLFDLAIYHVFTKRCISDHSESMQAKSVELDEYLPFDEQSKIVKLDASLTLEGDLPVIDGAAALYPVFSAFVHAVYPEESVVFDGENFTADSALQYTNTLRAYKGVVDGSVDIAICASPSEAQLAYADENSVELEFVPIGREAFVFIVNAKNPVEGLTVDEVRGIYAGRYKNWAEVGGANIPISPLQRIEGSGSQSAMVAFMNGEEIARDYDSFLGAAIGFSFRYYVEGIVGEGGVKMLALNGVYPSAENVRNGSYPVISEFYAVYRKDNDNPNVSRLVEWMCSEEGQQIVEESGYCPIK